MGFVLNVFIANIFQIKLHVDLWEYNEYVPFSNRDLEKHCQLFGFNPFLFFSHRSLLLVYSSPFTNMYLTLIPA